MEKLLEMLEEIKPEHDFKSSKDFIEDGLLDSFDVISLVNMIEEEFDVMIDGMDIIPENFCNLEAIMAIIVKCKGN